MEELYVVVKRYRWHFIFLLYCCLVVGKRSDRKLADYEERIDELLGIMVEILTSSSKTIRVNREEKPAQVVKGQFHKITKNHIEFVLHSMNESQTKARNIRALLVTALYNSVHTISTYYGNLVQYHMATDIYTAKEVEE